MPRLAFVLTLLLAGCSAGDLPPRWLGLADVEGRISLPAGADVSKACLSWVNLDRRRPDRVQETGEATRIGPDGSFLIESLPYGTYELTVAFADGTPRKRRLVVDEPRESVELSVPTGAISVPPPAGRQLDQVALRPFGAATPYTRVDPPAGEPVRFDGLAPGQW